MKLMTKAIENKIPALYSGENIPLDEKICHVKFFHPFCQMTWFATEFDPETGLFFGWVENGQMSEWGNFSLQEMQSLKVKGLKMERDMYFKPKQMKDISNYQRNG